MRAKPSHKKCLKDIAKYIREHQLNQTGIIYCGTQALCERVCGELQEELKAKNYTDANVYFDRGV